VLSWAPSDAGRAALGRALREAAGTAATLVVVPEGAGSDGDALAEVTEVAAALGMPVEVARDGDGRSVVDLLIDLSYTRRTSTAQQVLLEAGCPVLAVKAPVAAAS
jgi:nucleotide-binding universal stress UspA family protein